MYQKRIAKRKREKRRKVRSSYVATANSATVSYPSQLKKMMKEQEEERKSSNQENINPLSQVLPHLALAVGVSLDMTNYYDPKNIDKGEEPPLRDIHVFNNDFTSNVSCRPQEAGKEGLEAPKRWDV